MGTERTLFRFLSILLSILLTNCIYNVSFVSAETCENKDQHSYIIDAISDKNHVLIIYSTSRGISYRLFSIAEELLLNENDNYFITFLVPSHAISYLDDFVTRYPLEHNKEKYQIVMAPPDIPLINAVNIIEFAQLYIDVFCNSFYTLFPSLLQYLNHDECNTKIAINYTKYNVSFKNDVVYKAIDVALIPWYNFPTIYLTKMYDIPTVLLQTQYHFLAESRTHLSDSSIVSAQRVFHDFPNFPYYSYLQRLKNDFQRVMLRMFDIFVVYKFNKILKDEFDIKNGLNNFFDGITDCLILKSMGPPAVDPNIYKSNRYQDTGFLLPKHLDSDKPWIDNVTLKLFGSFQYQSIIEWVNNHQNVIYISFGTFISDDSETLRLFNILLKKVLSLEFLEINDFNILWSMRTQCQQQLSLNYSQRFLFADWIPQRELLHHPNIKMFITHGGTASISESIYASTPFLIVVYNLDERIGNAVSLKRTGCSDYVNIDDADKVFQHKILELSSNESYAAKCKELKERINFFGGTKNAVKVLNYAMKYGIKDIIPSVSVSDLSWFQRTNIDYYIAVIGMLMFWCYCIKKGCC